MKVLTLFLIICLALIAVMPFFQSAPASASSFDDTWAWGYNNEGQLGDGNTSDSTTAIQVSDFYGVRAIASGQYHSLALKHDGTVWAWGYNSSGELGDGTNTESYIPVQVSGLTGIQSISSGYSHGLALKSNGTVWAWGYNSYGQLGNGTTTSSNTPVQISDLTGVQAISTGYYHSLAVKYDGTVWSWGYNNHGQLGNGTTDNSNTPVQISGLTGVQSVSGGYYHSLALKSDGTAIAWGYNNYGQLGDGTTTESHTPVNVTGLSGIQSISTGSYHNLAVKSDGTGWAWGLNNYGQLGDGTATDRYTAVGMSGLSGIETVAGGDVHSLVLKSDGTVWACGYNNKGQLGDGTTTDRHTPVQVSGLSGIGAIGAGMYHSLAVKPDSTSPTATIDDINDYVKVISSISGSASDTSSGVASVELFIKNTTDTKYWDGDSWEIAQTWLTATGTTSWSYDSSTISFTDTSVYQVKARATNNTGNTTASDDQPSDSFTCDTTNPSVTINEIERIIVTGRPPETKVASVPVPEPETAIGINVLSDVPAFDWSYGCSATSAAMLFGYYDRTGYSDMYTGATNSGLCPLDNSVWGSTTYPGVTCQESPLSATHQGIDGLISRGHVDDYWIDYGNAGPDPYIVNGWSEHDYEDCTGDFMGTNQSSFGNTDGGTTFYFYTNGTAIYDYTDSEPGNRDGCHGMRLFAESHGYSVVNNFSQKIEGYPGIDPGKGFSFSDFQAEIDAGRPVLIQIEGHTMLGYGYDTTSSIIYVHDTWDYSAHTMTWGGEYDSRQHYGVTVFQMEALDTPALATSDATDTTADSATLNGRLNSPGDSGPVNVSFEWGTVSGALDQETAPQTMTSTGTFTANLTGLVPNTTYYFRAKASSSSTVYGTELNFDTSPFVNSVTSISGTASDASSGVTSVELYIYNSTNSKYWDGHSWEDALTWLTATGTTSWSYDSSAVTFADGKAYQVKARATDNAGNTTASGDQPYDSFGYDSTNPPATITDIDDYVNSLSSISGTASDATSGVDSMELYIYNSTDSKYWDGNSWEDALTWLTASGTTSWTYDSSAVTFTDGRAYQVKARVIDNAGNVTASGDQPTDSFTYDTTASSATITNINDYVNVLTSISGSASDATSGVAYVEVWIYHLGFNKYWGGSSWVSSQTWLTASGTTSWSYDSSAATFADSSQLYLVKARATDNAGNTTAIANQPYDSFRYDTTAPSAAIADINYFINSLSSISGTASDTTSGMASVELYIYNSIDTKYWDGNSWEDVQTWLTATGTTAWSYNSSAVTFAEGKVYEVRARATDNIGNTTASEAQPSDSFTYDTVAPQAAITDIPDFVNTLGSISGTTSDTISGVAYVELYIKNTTDTKYWDGDSWEGALTWLAASGTTSWSYDSSVVSFADGRAYEVRARATDNVGNTTASSDQPIYSFGYDSTNPSATITNIEDYVNTLTSISGTASDATSGIAYVELYIYNSIDTKYWDGDSWEDTLTWLTATGNTSWSYDSSVVSFADGRAYQVKAMATDNAGNTTTSGDQPYDSFGYDSTNPSAAVTDIDDYVNALTSISGTASDATSGVAYVELYIYNSTYTKYWNGNAWEDALTWLTATGTTVWSYDSSTVTFTDGKDYQVKARATDNVGHITANSDQSSDSFTYYVTPTASFSAEPVDIRAGEPITFTDTSTGTITGWQWNFDNDGSIDSTDQNPSHTFNSPGTYSVSLKITGPGGDDIEIKSDYITVEKEKDSDWSCFNSARKTNTSAKSLLTGWVIIGMCWGGGYWIVRGWTRRRKRRGL